MILLKNGRFQSAVACFEVDANAMFLFSLQSFRVQFEDGEHGSPKGGTA